MQIKIIDANKHKVTDNRLVKKTVVLDIPPSRIKGITIDFCRLASNTIPLILAFDAAHNFANGHKLFAAIEGLAAFCYAIRKSSNFYTKQSSLGSDKEPKPYN